ncbi:MAG: hypothetical protein KatS3mg104_2468 [Phycisphaerae bacterium]|jgi:hypothetical protein|nr:MAG: hypothetical protein KatS3mg104_2468 [Phycisphaerae bacterium]
MRHIFWAASAISAFAGIVQAGPYAPAAGQVGSTAIPYNDSRFVGWATGGTLVRGPQDINNPTGPLASFGVLSDAFGSAGTTTTAVVSLGDGGFATLTFDQPIRNGPGVDFAVFENGFSDTFLELAFVEVSSNGINFFRFPAYSETQTTTQVGGFGLLDPTNLHNLAGKYRVGYGTPFDLDDLLSLAGPTLDLNHITHVRVIDVVGRIDAAPGNPSYIPSLDSLGRVINDPYSTPFASSGFDLDGIGVINQVPEPSILGVMGIASGVLLRRRRKLV